MLDKALQALADASTMGADGATMKNVALRLAAGGWPVFPCGLDKSPLVAGGFKARSKSAAQINEWWRTHPEAMPGICPGDNGYAALDVDSMAAFNVVSAAGVDPQAGFVVETGGTSVPFGDNGKHAPRHVYVAATGQPKLPGVVSRYLSGYVIAPGARRGDRRYTVTRASDPPIWHGGVEGQAETTAILTGDAPSYERVAQAVRLIPNGEDVSRERYVAMAHMIKGAMGDEGLDLFLEWAAKYPGADVAEDTRVFETIRVPKSGWLTLASVASQYGFDAAPEVREAARDAFAELPLPPGTPIPVTEAEITEISQGLVVIKTPREKLQEMLERVQHAPDDLERSLALLALRKAGFIAADIRALLATLTEAQVSDEGNTLGELLKSPELLREPAPAIPFLAWPGLKTLLAAREKAGKSTFALAGAAVASSGGQFLEVDVTKQRVVWITEEPLQIAVQRAASMNADPENFVIVGMGINPREQLRKAVEKWAPQVVVIDTLYRFAGVEDENDAVAWMPILLQFDEITRAGIALLILAHSVKGERGGYRGSSAIGGFVDAILEMKTPKEGETVRKYAGRGRLSYGQGFSVKLRKDGGFELHEGPPRDATQMEVLAYLREHPGSTRREIVRGIKVKTETVQSALLALEAGSEIENKGDDDQPKWHATEAQDDFNDEVTT